MGDSSDYGSEGKTEQEPSFSQTNVIGRTTNTSPTIIINSNEDGILTGTISSTNVTYTIPTTNISTGNNNIVLSNLAIGFYNNNSITITDSANNSRTKSIAAFTIIAATPTTDITAPSFSQTNEIGTTTNTSPIIIINSNENGTLTGTLTGTISSTNVTYTIPTTNISTGNNNIVLSNLAIGFYNNNSITITDSANNSRTESIADFTIIAATTPEMNTYIKKVRKNVVYIPDKNLMKYRENPKIEFDKDPVFNESVLCDPDDPDNSLKVFTDKNVTPYNHYRKIGCPDPDCKKQNTIAVYKDNLALSVGNKKICVIRDNKWRIRYTETERIQREKNRKNFMSSSTLLENRNRNYQQNFKFPNRSTETPNIINPTKINKTVIKHNNPKFLQTGAVSSRNRIAALKNGNNHNNIYKKRRDTRTAWNKTNEVVKKQCKPYHYGGKMGISLLTPCLPKSQREKVKEPHCPPKN